MFTDLSGFSRQVAAFGIIHFLQVIFEKKRLLLPIVAAHDGILIRARTPLMPSPYADSSGRSLPGDAQAEGRASSAIGPRP